MIEKNKKVSKNIKVRLFFEMARKLQKNLLKNSETIPVDTQHWIDNGWIN